MSETISQSQPIPLQNEYKFKLRKRERVSFSTVTPKIEKKLKKKSNNAKKKQKKNGRKCTEKLNFIPFVEASENCTTSETLSSDFFQELTGLDFSCGWLTNKGDRKENQDIYIVTTIKDLQHKQQKIPLWGILDGHGALGAEASKDSAKLFQQLVEHNLDLRMKQIDTQIKMKSIFDAVNSSLLNSAKLNKQEYGTTAVVATLIMEDSIPYLVVGNVGDSRAILIRKIGKKNTIIPLSSDHKLEREDEHQRILCGSGKIIIGSSGSYRVIPDPEHFTIELIVQENLGLNMTRALGHIILRNYGVIADPEFLSVKLNVGDILIIASDGLWEFMNNKEVVDFVSKYKDAQLACRDLCKQVQKICKKRNVKSDNVTILIVMFSCWQSSK